MAGADEREEQESGEAREPRAPPARPRRRRAFVFVILLAGVALAVYLGSRAPRDQHVRFVLGDAAPVVTELDVSYFGPGCPNAGDEACAEPARQTHMIFATGRAPRIVAHDPELPNGDYLLQIEIDTTGGRKTAERRATLGGGTTSVDLGAALSDNTDP